VSQQLYSHIVNTCTTPTTATHRGVHKGNQENNYCYSETGHWWR